MNNPAQPGPLLQRASGQTRPSRGSSCRGLQDNPDPVGAALNRGL